MIGRLRLSKKHRERAAINKWYRDVERIVHAMMPAMNGMLAAPERRWFTLRHCK